MPADTVAKAFALGMLWGWLPCGLVYGVLTTALVSGGAASGAGIMLAFGLVTLPNLLLAGMAFKRLREIAANRRLRLVAGALVAAFGFAGLPPRPIWANKSGKGCCALFDRRMTWPES